MTARPKLISIIGARPQFIKLAPLIKPLAGRFRHFILHTGQHHDLEMSDIFFRQLHLPSPDVNLGISGGSHGAMTGRMLAAAERVLAREKPAAVLVYGDTNSTLAGALAAAKLGIPIAHIEAGMRSYVRDMPEEINRRVADHLSSLLFCASLQARRNLQAEGIRAGLVYTGDVMHELLQQAKKSIAGNRRLLRQHGLAPGQFLFMTVHRAANVDEPEDLERLLAVLEALPLPTLFPIHPRTQQRLRRHRLWSRLKLMHQVQPVAPLGYFDTLTAACHARVVLTDSGGLQKEALYLGTPVLTLRRETEWVETLCCGNRLVGHDPRRILRSIAEPPRVKKIAMKVRGRRPSQIITESLQRFLGRE